MTAQTEGLDISCPADKSDEARAEDVLGIATDSKRSIAERDEREHLNLVRLYLTEKFSCPLGLEDVSSPYESS